MSDEAVKTLTIYKSIDYKKWKPLPGPRPINIPHVNFLAKKIKAKNLIMEKPLEMVDHETVLDGMHRIRACEILNVPIYYVIKPLLNSDDMIEINTGNRNWGWSDFAASFSNRGNKNYSQFLELYEEFGGRFSTILKYCGVLDSRGKRDSTSRNEFHSGNFVMQDFELARKLLGQLDDIKEASKVRTYGLENALYQFMRTPKYDHERMVSQIRKFGEVLNTCYRISDYLYELEQIYLTHK